MTASSPRHTLRKLSFLISLFSSLVATCLSLTACDMMEGLYDDTNDGTDTTTVAAYIQTSPDKSQYYINATSYTQWVYINLHTDPITITTSNISLDDFVETGAPAEWDYAHHRYDAKTNGATVWMTPYTSIADLEAAGLPADANWVADTQSQECIAVDMSHMITDSYLVYAPGYKNEEMSRWVNVDITYMPPTYTLHNNVMLLHLADGTYAAVQLENFMSTDRYQVKGWMTVNYKYPVFLGAGARGY